MNRFIAAATLVAALCSATDSFGSPEEGSRLAGIRQDASLVEPAAKPDRHRHRRSGSGVRTAAESERDPTVAGSVHASAFGSVAIPFERVATRGDWRRISAELDDLATGFCESGKECSERVQVVDAAMTRGNEDRSLAQILSEVNIIANDSLQYAPDEVVYGRFDHWAAPAESLAAGMGDCEDYVFLKMAMLRRLGVPSKSMSLVVVKDQRRDLHHAVLTLATNRGILVLDNLRSDVVWDHQLSHYLPLYSFSDDRSWLHGRKSDPGAVAAGPVDPAVAAPGGATAGSASRYDAADRPHHDALHPTAAIPSPLQDIADQNIRFR